MSFLKPVRALGLTLLLLPCLVTAQENGGEIRLADKSAVEIPGSHWRLVQAVQMDPVGRNAPRTDPGAGILLGSPGTPAGLRQKVRDLRFTASFMVSPGAMGYILLPGDRKILLADSRDIIVPDARSSGYAGEFPLQNAAKAPGLWQSLELSYDLSVPDAPASSRINYLKLNGIVVQEALYFPGAGPLQTPEAVKLEVTKGYIAFRDMVLQPLESRKPVALQDLAYHLYSDKWDAKSYAKLEQAGKSPVLTQDVHKGLREFHLVYEGAVQVSEPGTYTFEALYTGPAFSLDINGKNVITGGESSSQEVLPGVVSLEPGRHPFRLYYARFPWRPPALGLRVSKPGVRTYELHDLASLPEPAPKPYLKVTPGSRTEIIRSFVQLPHEKNKRTHCASVGTPAGLNFTMDLNRGALLQVWRGDFADVTDMWYQRGEPQLLQKAGMGVEVSRKSNLAFLDGQQVFPDSSEIDYLGYTLQDDGTPEFRYRLGKTVVYDLVRPSGASLVRTVRVPETVGRQVFLLLGSGKTVKAEGAGRYRIDDRLYVEVKEKAVIRTQGEAQELLVPVNGTVTCTLSW